MGKNILKEIFIVIIAGIILSMSFIYPLLGERNFFLKYFIIFVIVIGINITIKKIVARSLDINIETKFWSVYHFWFRERDHLKKPLPMVWLPLILSIFSNGLLQWFPILEFEEKARIERIARRHELYRFSAVTEWHSGLIAFGGLFSNIILFIFSFLIGFNDLAKISLFYSVWALIPLSSLDGNKILFGSRKLWVFSCALVLISLIFFSFFF